MIKQKKIFLNLYIIRLMLLAFCGCLQLGFFGLCIFSFFCANTVFSFCALAVFIFGVVFAIGIIVREDNSSYRSFWLALALLTPIFAAGLYFFVGRKRLSKRLLKRLADTDRKAREALSLNKSFEIDIDSTLSKKYKGLANVAFNAGMHPLYGDSSVVYYKSGEEFKDAIINAVRQAQHSIFLEFFIFQNGQFLDELIWALLQKAAIGVEVKIIYDSFGCKGKLDKKTVKHLVASGIEMVEFNPIKSSFNTAIRDHRKIVIVDSSVAFCAGINVSDKYVNITHPFGHWRDDGVKICGAAALSFCVMFLRQYELVMGKGSIDFGRYIKPFEKCGSDFSHGLVQPISDGADSEKQILKNVFLQLISSAEDSLYISTPYLLLDDQLLGAIVLKAKSGVKVSILVPHIPDKKFVFRMTRAFCKLLALDRVKIYEYSHGFNHAKCVIADSKMAYVGTCNVDYRSFYSHYECGALLYESPVILDVESSLKAAILSSELKEFEPLSDSAIKSGLRGILRLIAQFF